MVGLSSTMRMQLGIGHTPLLWDGKSLPLVVQFIRFGGGLYSLASLASGGKAVAYIGTVFASWLVLLTPHC